MCSRSSWEDGGPPTPSPEGRRSHSPGGAGEELRLQLVRDRGSDCKLAGRGENTVGPRIQLWEAGIVSQSLPPRRTTMEEEGVRNFKELQAKFQKLNASPLPGPIKSPAGVSRKDDRGSTQPAQDLANRKCYSSHHYQTLSYSSTGVSQPLTNEKLKSAQRDEIQKSSSSLGIPEKSTVYPERNFQKAAMLLDVSTSRAEISDKEKGMTFSSFRYKLWNWEKVSSQKSEMSPPPLLTNGAIKTFHLEGQKTMGLAQGKPEKSLKTSGAQTLPPQSHLMAQRKLPGISKASDSSLPPHSRKTTESPSTQGSHRSSPCQPVYEYELDSLVPEKPESRHCQLPKTKPLPSIETLGPPPPKPSKPLFVNLYAFHRQPAAVSMTLKEVTMKESPLPPDSAELEEAHNYDTTISYLSHFSNSINFCAAGESAEATYEIEIEELQKPWKSFLLPELSPRPKDLNSMEETEPCDLEPPKPRKEPRPTYPPKVVVYEETPGKTQMTGIHENRRSLPAGNQEAMTDIIQNRLFPEDGILFSSWDAMTRHSQDKNGYVEALEVTKETPSPSTIRSSSSSEKTYDDVECSREDIRKWDFSSSFTSDSEENSEEMYEDIYKAKNNDPKTEVAGRAALRRLQQIFRKENIFGMKKTKSKEIIRDEDKVKTWKTKFLKPKGKNGGKGSLGSKSFSPRHFFRTKKQKLEKNRMKKEEKLFRERFQYGKEIMVINRAVACSSNSRNGIFDLPITPGEQLEVIDTTEQNLVICRNSKGKYGYVLIEHLDFKHQG
ncbi:FYN-binding protein 2 isoform X2 [Mastomys coucha]|uniref:FYN-binding protein 2 isoform X2 n=1 Tax=Mastomys coucha TaxID=35658 RepID=UPI0012626548|nr:FYN-binding protein 2 isoform X2 [Mastomys coucha]